MILSDPAHDFGSETQVAFGGVVILDHVSAIDGDLHCIVSGAASGTGRVVVRDGGIEIIEDPGIVCYRDAAELAAILDRLLAQAVGQVAGPGSGQLRAARSLFGNASSTVGQADPMATLRLAFGSADRLMSAAAATGRSFQFLVFLIHAWIAEFRGRVFGEHCHPEFERSAFSVSRDQAFASSASQDFRFEI